MNNICKSGARTSSLQERCCGASASKSVRELLLFLFPKEAKEKSNGISYREGKKLGTCGSQGPTFSSLERSKEGTETTPSIF